MFHIDPRSFTDLGSPTGSPKREYILFTDKSIKHLKPAGKRRVVWASGLKGLGVRVTPSGGKSFVYKYDVDGQDRWLTFGQYPKMKLSEALRRYAEAAAKVEVGEDPAAESINAARAARNAATVRELVSEYIEKYAKPRKRSWREDERVLNREVIPRWGSKKASKITKRDVLDLLDDIVARGAPVQANRTLAVVRRMFNFAIDRDLLAVTPCNRVKPPAPERPKDRYLTLEELKRFWTGLDTAPLARRTKLYLKLLTVTLQRSTEVAGINRRELDMHAKTWIIPASRSKNKKSHLVPLSPLAFEIVAELLKKAGPDGYLFPSEGDGDHLTKSGIARAITRNLDHFDVAKFTPHDLRRTGSTQLAAFKVPRFDRDRVLNHTDQTIGAVYDVYEYQDEKRAVLALWSDIIKRVTTGKAAPDMTKLRSALKYQAYLAE